MFEAITDNIFFKLALVVVAACCIMSLLSANAESEALRAECAALEEQISDTNERILSLENDLSAEMNEAYIIKVARERLNMRLPEEIVFVTNIADD